MSKDIRKVPHFTVSSVKTKKPHTPFKPSKTEVFRLKPWQKEGYVGLANKRLRQIVVPTGAGKSFLIKALAIKDRNAGQKVIVCYPQNTIRDSFKNKQKIDLPGDGVQIWDPKAPDKEIRTAFKKFLKTPAKDSRSASFVCSHAALGMVVEEVPKAKSGVSVFVDEAHKHHLDQNGKEIAHNRLGKLSDKLLKRADCKLTYVTATFMRNDGGIVPEELQKEFTRYKLPVPDYLETMEHLREINISYAIGKQIEMLEGLLKSNPHQKTILFIERGLDPKDQKPEVVRNVIKVLKKLGLSCVDLVSDDSGRDKRRKDLMTAIEVEKSSQGKISTTPDVVLALNMMTEGTDWPACERVILLAPRSSMIETIQMMGRVWRDWPGKKKAEFITILSRESGDPEEIRNHLKSLCVSLVAEWTFQRVKFSKNHAKTVRKHTEDILGQLDVNQEIIDAISDAATSAGSTQKTIDLAVQKALREIVQKHGLSGKEAVKVEAALWDAVESRARASTRETKKRLKVALPSLDEIDMMPDIKDQKYGFVDVLTSVISAKTLREYDGALRTSVDPEAALEMLLERARKFGKSMEDKLAQKYFKRFNRKSDAWYNPDFRTLYIEAALKNKH